MKSVQISQNAKSIIPKNWQLKKLKEIASIESGFGFPIKYQGKSEGDIPFFKVSDISRTVLQGGIYLTRADNFISHEDCKIIKAKPLRKGTIVFARIGEAIKLNRRAILGQDSLIDNNIAGVFSNSNNLYLYYCLLNIKFGDFTGITAVPSLKKSDIENQIILFPSEQEQQKIASILSNVDELIQKTDQIIEQTQRLKKGLMQRLLTKGIRHTKFKKTELGEIPEEWKISTANSFLQINMGQSPPSTTYNNKKEGLPFYQGVSDFGELFPKSRIWCSNPKKIANENEILFSVRAPVGELNLTNEKCCIGRGVASLIPISSDMKYCFYLLKLFRDKFTAYSQGSTFEAINRDEIGKVKLPFTSDIREQQKIASILSNVDELIQNELNYKSKLENLKKGLMQQLLTGKIRVKV